MKGKATRTWECPKPFMTVLPVLLGFLYFFTTCMASASTVKKCALACIIAMFILGAFRFRKLLERVGIPLVFLFLYVIMCGISTFYAVSGKFALQEFLKVLIGFSIALCLLAISPAKEKMIGRFIACILATCAALSSIVSIDMISTHFISDAVLGFFGLFTEDYKDLSVIGVGVRIKSMFSNANVFAGFCGIGVLLSLGMADTAVQKSRERIYAVILLFVTSFGFVLAFSMGGSLFIALAFLAFFILEPGEGRGSLLVLMVETLIVTLLCAGLVSATSFHEWTGVQPIPLICTAAGAACLVLIDRFIGIRLGNILNIHRKKLPMIIGIIAFVAAAYAVAAVNLTGPADVAPGELLRRAIYADPGTYHLKVDSSGPVRMLIKSQNYQETMMHTNTVLNRGFLEEETMTFTVPEDSIVTILDFYSEDGCRIRSAEYDGKSIPMDYKLIPEFITRRLQGLFANQDAIQRIVFFEDGIKLFRRSPIIGNGMGAFENGVKGVQSFYYETKYVHNHYIQLLVETGVIGLALFLLLLGSSAAAIFRCRFGKNAVLGGSLVPALGALLVFMAGHALTEVVFSSYPYLPMAFGVFVLVNLCCGDRITHSGMPKAVRAGALGSIALFTAVYGFFLCRNMYAGYLVEKEPSLETIKKAADMDLFEWPDYAFSYVIYALQNYPSLDDETRLLVDHYAARLETRDSNTTAIYLAEYYFMENNLERAFRMLEKHLDYVSSDASGWQIAFDVLRRYESHDEVYVEGVRRIIEKLDAWNEQNMGEITIDENAAAFVERMRQQHQ